MTMTILELSIATILQLAALVLWIRDRARYFDRVKVSEKLAERVNGLQHACDVWKSDVGALQSRAVKAETRVERYVSWLSWAFPTRLEAAKAFQTDAETAALVLKGDPPALHPMKRSAERAEYWVDASDLFNPSKMVVNNSIGQRIEKPPKDSTRPGYLFLCGEIEAGYTMSFKYQHKDLPFEPEFLLARASKLGLVFRKLQFDSQIIAEEGLFEHLETMRLLPRFMVKSVVVLELKNTSYEKISFGLRIEGRYREEVNQ